MQQQSEYGPLRISWILEFSIADYIENYNSTFLYRKLQQHILLSLRLSVLPSVNDYILINLLNLFSDFHIVFPLSKPLNQPFCMKNTEVSCTQVQIYTLLLTFDKSSEELIRNNEDL